MLYSKDKLCTYNKTGKNFCFQQFYRCLTCYPQNDPSNLDKGICESCKNICHKGHHIVNLGMRYAFCDCGFGDCPIKCKCLNKKENKEKPGQKSKIKMSPFLPHRISENEKQENESKMSLFLPHKIDKNDFEANETKINEEIELENENKAEELHEIESNETEKNESIKEEQRFIKENINIIENEKKSEIQTEVIKNNEEIEPEEENKTEDPIVIESNKIEEIHHNDEIENEKSHLDENIKNIEENEQEKETKIVELHVIESNKNEIKPIEVHPKEIPKNEQSLFLRSVKSPIKKPKIKTPPKPRIFHLYV